MDAVIMGKVETSVGISSVRGSLSGVVRPVTVSESECAEDV